MSIGKELDHKLTEGNAPPVARSILFSGPMVRALLAGTKTQTRRALRGPPDAAARHRFGEPGGYLWVRETFYAFGRWEIRFNAAKQREEWYFVDMTRQRGYAYGYEADREADREAAAIPQPGSAPARRAAGAAPMWHKRPALFMPRVASRILLRVVEVRIERLQDISDGDALAEGIPPDPAQDPVLAYRGVWERINGPGSWETNPRVWVVEFNRVRR